MSKLSFRARALDASKPLPIYHARDVPDLSDYQAINRTVPQMPTGMEKEEETERHLQEVILAQQTNCRRDVFIPTPEVDADDVGHYEQIYSKLQHRQSPYIRVPGLGLEEEVPDYDLDSEDEEWLSAQTKERPLSPLHFEKMMDKLERGSGNTVLSVRDAQSLLKDEEDLVIAVYDYWLAKRLRLGRALIPAVKHERRDGTSSSNPYLAFRKRTEKMQTRKNRKNDEMAYMQMLKLKRDLTKAKNLAEFVLERENKKHHLAHIETDIFKRRYQLEDWSGSILSSLRPVSTHTDTALRHPATVGDGWETKHSLIKVETDDQVQVIGRQPVLLSTGLRKKSKKRKFYFPHGTPEPELVTPATPEKREVLQPAAVEKSEEEEFDGIFTFKRRPHVRYHKVDEEVDWDVAQGVPLSLPHSWKRYCYNQTAFSGCYIGRARRRIGRGGRVLWDRACGSESEEEEETEEPLGPSGTAEGNKEGEALDPSLKRCRYISRSPSPTSNFEFQSFPLIENTNPSSQPADPVNSIAIFEFSGFTSDSEFPEDASSFSSLPTSQFTLKPSTSDVECENSSSQGESMDTSRPPSSSATSQQRLLERNSGPQNPKTVTLVDSSRNNVSSTGAPQSGGPLKQNLVPQNQTNMFALKPPPMEHVRKPQQQPPVSQNSSAPLARVQNLAPEPPSTRPPLLVPSSTVPSPTTTSSLTPSLSSSLQKHAPVPEQSGMSSALATPTSVTSLVASGNAMIQKPSGTLKNHPPQPSTGGLVDPRLKHGHSHEHKVAGDGSVGSSTNTATGHTTTGATSSDTGASVDSLNLKSDRTPTPNGLTNPTPVITDTSTTDTTVPPTSSSSSSSFQTSWLMDGPSSNILLLSSRSSDSRKPQKSSSVEGDAREVMLGSSMVDAASAITSQFLQHTGGAREETGGRQTVDQIQSTLQQTARGIPLGIGREIPLPLVQGTVPMTSSRLPTPASIAATKLEGHPHQIFNKRAASAQNLVTRRASATANGGPYPEIFHTSARRFSETTERGIKQALAG
jgi:enhancer of polycomb-like protein